MKNNLKNTSPIISILKKIIPEFENIELTISSEAYKHHERLSNIQLKKIIQHCLKRQGPAAQTVNIDLRIINHHFVISIKGGQISSHIYPLALPGEGLIWHRPFESVISLPLACKHSIKNNHPKDLIKKSPLIFYIEDNDLLREGWKISFAEHKINLHTFSRPSLFLKHYPNPKELPRNALFFIDAIFEGTKERGEELALTLYEMGLRHIFLTTGKNYKDFSGQYWLSGVYDSKLPPLD